MELESHDPGLGSQAVPWPEVWEDLDTQDRRDGSRWEWRAPYSYEEVAAELGLSKARVQQVELEALNKLRVALGLPPWMLKHQRRRTPEQTARKVAYNRRKRREARGQPALQDAA